MIRGTPRSTLFHYTTLFRSKVIIDGDDAFVTYNGWTTDGRLFRNTEHVKSKDAKTKENECFFGQRVNFPNNTKKSKHHATDPSKQHMNERSYLLIQAV